MDSLLARLMAAQAENASLRKELAGLLDTLISEHEHSGSIHPAPKWMTKRRSELGST